MKMKNIILLIVTLTLFIPFSGFAETKWIDGFSSSKVGDFPKGWRTRPGEGGKARQTYKVQEEGGNKYLEAKDPSGISAQIFKMAHWDIDKYPVLTWKWRAKKLPKGANETVPSKNDSACGIYISFGMSRGKALKYVWSSTAPKDTFYKKNDNMYIIVKRTGNSSKWVTEKTNIVEDAKKAWGKVPDRVLSGIAILTDSDATKSSAACDYDNIGYSN